MTRQRGGSMLSFNRKSSGSVPKVDLIESPQEKASHRVTSKADPSKALNEKQPAFQALEQSTIDSIRSMQHRDANGNIITDPDRSNPTRPRLERPLDTIRSFEAAIDGSYNRRPISRTASTDVAGVHNRRSSYHQGYNNSQQRSPGDGGGYYGNRNSIARPDSYIDNYAPPPPNHHYQSQGRRFGPRVNSDPALYGQNSQSGQGVYPSHGYQQSYDTVASSLGNGSHATDQWGNSTDPSSENSSIDRVPQAPKPDIGEAYGFNGFGGAPQFQGPILEEYGQGYPAYGQPGYGHQQNMTGPGYQPNGSGSGPPAPPPHVFSKESAPRVPIKLGNLPNGAGTTRAPSDANSEKRKSWLKRRFSRN